MSTPIIQWLTQRGDPGMPSWLIAAGYMIAAWLCLRAAGQSEPAPSRWLSDRGFWRLTALLLLLLGLNKQLDLHSLFTDVMRSVAREQGWYKQRRAYQLVFTELMGLAALLGLGGLIAMLRGRGWTVAVAVAGVMLLTLFVLVRAASFHHVDMLLGQTPFGIKIYSWLEIGGILVTGAAAALSVRDGRRIATARP